MCVLALAWRSHPRWRLVVMANRDEFHARPSEPLHRWRDPAIVAGRDMSDGGTWLAVSERGRFAAVTNLRGYGERRPDRVSRGALVVSLATKEESGSPPYELYNPFNAISIEGEVAVLLTNRPSVSRRSLAPGLHAVSNGPADQPWGKMERLKAALGDWLGKEAASKDALFDSLREPGVPSGALAKEEAIFILDPVYGTRCSTIVLVGCDGAGAILERRYDARGDVAGEGAVGFSWP